MERGNSSKHFTLFSPKLCMLNSSHVLQNRQTEGKLRKLYQNWHLSRQHCLRKWEVNVAHNIANCPCLSPSPLRNDSLGKSHSLPMAHKAEPNHKMDQLFFKCTFFFLAIYYITKPKPNRSLDFCCVQRLGSGEGRAGLNLYHHRLMTEEEKTDFVKALNEGPYFYRDVMITFEIVTSICLTHVASILLTQRANQPPPTYLDYLASFSVIKVDKTANVPPPIARKKKTKM